VDRFEFLMDTLATGLAVTATGGPSAAPSDHPTDRNHRS